MGALGFCKVSVNPVKEFKKLTTQRKKILERLPCLRGPSGETTSDYIQAQKEIYQINQRLESLEWFSHFKVGMVVKQKKSPQLGIIHDMGKDETGNLMILVRWEDKSQALPAQPQELILQEETPKNFQERFGICPHHAGKTEPTKASQEQLSESDSDYEWLDPTQVNLTAGTQSRVTLDSKAIKRYQEDMIEGRWNYQESPPVVFFDGTNYYPGDGHHRIKAAALAKAKIYCEIRRGTLRDAIRYSCSANQRPSLHRTNADKRRAVELMYQTLIEEFGSLDAIPQSQGGTRKEQDWGIRRVAAHVGVGKSLVSEVRNQLELTVRIGQFQEGDRVEVICPKRCKSLNWIEEGNQGTVLGTNVKHGVYVKWDQQPPSYIHPERLMQSIDKPPNPMPKPKAQSQLMLEATDNPPTHSRGDKAKEEREKTLTSTPSPISSHSCDQLHFEPVKTFLEDSDSKHLASVASNLLPSVNKALRKGTSSKVERSQMSNSNADQALIKAVEQLLGSVEFSLTGTCIDLLAGESAIADALENTGLRLINNDPNADFRSGDRSNGASPIIWERLPEADWIIFHPPYTQASDFLPLAYKKAKKGLIALLELGYLEPSPDHAEWIAEHPPTQLICLPRISLANEDEIENVPLAWFIWLKDQFIQVRQPFTFITP